MKAFVNDYGATRLRSHRLGIYGLAVIKEANLGESMSVMEMFRQIIRKGQQTVSNFRNRILLVEVGAGATRAGIPRVTECGWSGVGWQAAGER